MLLSRFPVLFASITLWLTGIQASAIAKRAELGERAASTTVQWHDNSGIHLRSYHIRNDCTVVENSYNEGGSSWITNVLPFCADPKGNVVAVLLTGANYGPELIQLFFRGSAENSMRSALWRVGKGWAHDEAFNNLKAPTFPGTAIAWRTGGGIGQIRLYAIENKLDDYGEVGPVPIWQSYSHLFEYGWTEGAGWIAPSNYLIRSGKELNYGQVAATVTPGGGAIHLFYWDNANDHPFDRDTSFVNYAHWSSSKGWRVLGAPYSELRDYYVGGALAVVSWGEGSQVRLYVKAKEWSGRETHYEHEYSGGKWHEGKEMPGWSLDRLRWATQPSVVAWTHPGPADVHIRLYHARCHVSDSCRPYVHEIGFDTGQGWRDMANLPA